MDITLDSIKGMLGKEHRRTINQVTVDNINSLANAEDPLTSEAIKESFITHIDILKSSRWKMSDYQRAVKYVSLKLLGMSNIDSYIRTFPERYERVRADNREMDESSFRETKLSPFVGAYNRSQLVNAIVERTLIPHHVLNAPYYQEALDTQIRLMRHAGSEKVQQQAADSILTHLKPPEVNKLSIEVGFDSETRSNQKQTANTLVEIAANQKKMLEAGMPLSEIQKIGTTRREVSSDSEEVIDVDVD